MDSPALFESKCFICLKIVDTRSLAEHEKDCLNQLQDNLSKIKCEVDTLLDGTDSESVLSATSTGSNETTRKTVRCYICGHDFAHHFINVHEKQCKKNWDSKVVGDNLKKGASTGHISAMREIDRDTPKAAARSSSIRKAQSVVNMSHHEPKQAWNARMRESKENITKDNAKKRPTLSRKKDRPKSAYARSSSTQNLLPFSPKEFGIYDDTAELNKISGVISDKSVSMHDLSTNASKKEPQKLSTSKFIECQYCFKIFSIHSIHIHEKKCLSRADNFPTQARRTKSAGKNKRCVSVNALHSAKDSEDWLVERRLDSSLAASADKLNATLEPTTKPETPRFVLCTYCCKPFGSKSLPIHLPQCKIKFERANNESDKKNNSNKKLSQKIRLPRRNDKREPAKSAKSNLDRGNKDQGDVPFIKTPLKTTRSSPITGGCSPTQLDGDGISREGSGERTPTRKDSATRKQSLESVKSSHSSSSIEASKQTSHPISVSQADARKTIQNERVTPRSSMKPVASVYVACTFCGNYYGSASVTIHEAKCEPKMLKMKEEQKLRKLPTPRKQLGRFFGLQG